jgi:hypothetical protein
LIYHRWPFLFNVVIDGLNLKEIETSGRQFTWANNHLNPTYKNLDRVLVTTEWGQKFPLSSVVALKLDISDHTPLLLNSEEATSCPCNQRFKFELGWLLRDGFHDMFHDIWTNEVSGQTPMEKWQNKIRRLRQHLRGWEKNTSSAYKKEKKNILNKFYSLDKKVEYDSLLAHELDLKQCLQNRLGELLREEEIK